MSSRVELQKIQRIAELATGVSQLCITPLGRGATSAAWAATNGHSSVIIRMILLGTDRPTTYQSEFSILRLLRARGCYVPNPILNYAECPEQLPDIVEPWSVTEALKGRAIKKNRLTAQVAREVGHFLSILHSLPTTDYGRLAEQKRHLQGLQNSYVSGVCARWCWAEFWPFDGSRLQEHCISKTDPDLVQKLLSLETKILETGADQARVLIHSDLHGEHIFTQAGKLTGIIDFGASCIAIPAWDFAVLAYYQGWSITQEVLMAYHPSVAMQKFYLEQAQTLALAISLYKLAKAVQTNASPHKIARRRHFIARLLNSLENGSH